MNTGEKLREAIDRALDLTRRGWDLGPKIKLYPPETEAQCPYCNQWFPTNRIWLVNDNINWLAGCWTAEGKPIPSDQMVHPHAWMSGEVCLGEQPSASGALFAGIAKGKHVQYVPRWLWQLGHRCDKLPVHKCPVCNSTFFEDSFRSFGYKSTKVCSTECYTVAISFRCEECTGVLAMDQNRFCAPCEEKLYVKCNICSRGIMIMEAFHYSIRDLKCCYNCYTSNLAHCRDCKFMEHRVEVDESGICTTCRTTPAIRCAECDTRVDSVNDDGICNYCVRFCSECDCSPCECEPEPEPFGIQEPDILLDDEFEEEEDIDEF